MKLVSVVLPLYNEVDNIRVLHKALKEVFDALDYRYEFLFVDDGSTDGSAFLLEELARDHEHILGITLSRNFGHQIAIVAGMEHAKGDFVIMMDSDMQHPPEMIPKMIETAETGVDIVNMVRTGSSGNKPLKNTTSRWFYRIMNRMGEVKVEPSVADFRLMNRRAVEAFLKLKEKDRFTRGLVSWMGFEQAFIPYEARARHAGKTKYSYEKMFSFAGDGFVSFSSRPLRISFFLGLIFSIFGLGYAIFSVVQYFLGNTIPGWTSLMVVVLLLGGIQLLSLGIIGEYIARVFNEVKNRPLYYVKEYYSRKKVED